MKAYRTALAMLAVITFLQLPCWAARPIGTAYGTTTLSFECMQAGSSEPQESLERLTSLECLLPSLQCWQVVPPQTIRLLGVPVKLTFRGRTILNIAVRQPRDESETPSYQLFLNEWRLASAPIEDWMTLFIGSFLTAWICFTQNGKQLVQRVQKAPATKVIAGTCATAYRPVAIVRRTRLARKICSTALIIIAMVIGGWLLYILQTWVVGDANAVLIRGEEVGLHNLTMCAFTEYNVSGWELTYDRWTHRVSLCGETLFLCGLAVSVLLLYKKFRCHSRQFGKEERTLICRRILKRRSQFLKIQTSGIACLAFGFLVILQTSLDENYFAMAKRRHFEFLHASIGRVDANYAFALTRDVQQVCGADRCRVNMPRF